MFDLPPDYTVNSVSMGVVDNHWVAAPVPEPTTALMLAVRFMSLVGVRLRSRRLATVRP